MKSFDNIVNKIFKKKKKLIPKTVYINNNSNNSNIENEQISDNNNNSNSTKKDCKLKKKPNWISTTKYSLCTFIPKNLFEQFRKFTNLYFLGILVLSWLPNITPLPPGPSSINLTIVLLINAVKEGYEDFKRYQSDKKTNNQKCKIIKNNNIKIETCWKDLKEGDLVFIENGQSFPADLILLATSGESSPGQCFIETSNLDGESNLKYKQALLETNNSIIVTKTTRETAAATTLNNSTMTSISDKEGHEEDDENNADEFNLNNLNFIECEAPSVNLNKFDGMIQTMVNQEKSVEGEQPQQLPLSIDQLLIRGTVLMNTKYIIGCVVYVGHETKYMMNTMSTPTKRSKLELTMERILLYLLAVQLLLCFFSTLMGLHFDLKFGDTTKIGGYGGYHLSAWYLDIPSNYAWSTFTRFFTFLILFSTMIPISLYVTLEIIRFLQVISINKDKKMCYTINNNDDEEYDSKETTIQQFAMARTSNLNEELGQVEYIFSDKTGTLTRNEMVFKICCINGNIYGELPANSNETIPDDHGLIELPNIEKSINLSINENLEFVLALTICNTVLPNNDDSNGNGNGNGKIKYSSSSPDETALVEAASNIGIKLYSKTPNSITILNSNTNQFKKYTILNIIEFTSDRKRMSIIVKDQDTNEIILYTKGADSAILPLLDSSRSSSNEDSNEGEGIQDDIVLQKSKSSLKLFSCNGLRTLCICKRILLNDEYLNWNKIYKSANLSIVDRDLKLEEASKSIELKLNLLGITAIEDRLQDDLPNTISKLIEANIKIFILTGDKTETAINIGLSCSLLKDLELLILTIGSDEDKLLKGSGGSGNLVNNSIIIEKLILQIENYIKTIESSISASEEKQIKKEYGLIIDGSTLTYLLLSKECEELFYKLTCLAKSVVCSRCTPFQKSELVRIVKDRTKSITLAIGDGANDVSMIQKAHIGVGISGKEGRQAVLASDFSISQFKYLSRLLLVHGRYNYKRLSLVICYFFFKNLASCLLQFWFATRNQFSGTSIYDSINSMLYNLCFTSLPIIVIGVFETDLKSKYLLKYPKLYIDCQKGKSFNHLIFWSWIMLSLFSSAVIYYSTLFLFNEESSILIGDGKINGLRNQSAFAFTCLVFVVNFRLIMVVQRWLFLTFISFLITILFFFFIQIMYSLIESLFGYRGDYYHIYLIIVQLPTFYISLILVVVISLLPAFSISFIKRNYLPKPIHIIQEIQQIEKSNNRKIKKNDLNV